MTTPNPVPRVLLAEASLPVRRVIREALIAFRHCEVDDAASAEYAFELGLQRRYSLYIFAFGLPDMRGDLLDRLLARVVPKIDSEVYAAPPLLYLLRPEESPQIQELSRSARMRGHLFVPPRLDLLIQATAGLLPERNPHAP